MPITTDAWAVTYPDAGVMATRPTTRPVAAPTAVTLPERRKSTTAHVTSAAAAAVLVLVNASAAKPFAARADPALNPNQPNHNRPAPRSTSGTLCGTIAVRLKSLRAPSMAAATSAETPELMCTTVPPAKSSAPSFCSQPPAPQTQCARGSYTNVDQRTRNTTYARNRIRSAMAPEISAGVMIANISWNMACACSGIVAAYAGSGSTPTPRNPSHASPPHRGEPWPNAIE